MKEGKVEHWEKVYATKGPNEVSWTQEKPETSLKLIRSFGLPKATRIIDVGGGDSRLVDFLLDEGFENITVLDISAKALEKAKKRLGEKAIKVQWIASDITEFVPTEKYDIWHDRAAFHFLTKSEDISKYQRIIDNHASGYLIIGTFSENGPKKCSGLDIQQYSEERMQTQLSGNFDKLNCITEDHQTPFGTTQNFIFCSFKRKPEY